MEPSPEIEQLVTSWFSAASHGDASLVDRHVSASDQTAPRRQRCAGVAPRRARRRCVPRGEVEGAGGSVTFTPSETEAYREGSVGWAATKLTIRLPDGTHVAPRWTAVFVSRDDVWQFVQTHTSIAVGNDDAGWTYE